MGKQFDDKTYQTGHTAPPKSRGGLIAILLAVIILLGGVISILGLLNIHLFRKLVRIDKEGVALAEVLPDEGNSVLEPTRFGTDTVILSNSPLSPDNIPQEGGLSLQEIYTKTVDSVVTVETESVVGTGIVLTADGYILTNSYVVRNALEIQVKLNDGRQLKGALVGKDSFSDLAVLQVQANDLVPASFGDSTSLRVGDAVVSIGNPIGDSAGSMSDGIVSAINGNIEAGGSKLTLIQTNASLNTKAVGGPLINCYGQIVGINTLCAANVMSITGNEGVSFALDSVTVKQVADQLIAQGFVSGRIYLGIQGHEIDEFYENYYDIPQGIFITELDENSGLYQRGVREGDILLNLADTRILDFDTLNNLLGELIDGQEVTAVVYRDGTQYQLTVTVGD